MEMKITFSSNHDFVGCYLGQYFEIRDGLNQSATLLGIFCEFYKDKENVFRSSGRHMWLKFHVPDNFRDYYKFHTNYAAKSMNFTGLYFLTLYHFVYM